MLETANYLYTLNKEACFKYCEITKQDPLDVVPFKFETADDVFNCMQTFMSEGISLSYVFLTPSVWILYLKDISEERYYKAIELLLHHGTPLDLILFFRASYRFGNPVIADTEFDAIEKLYISTFPDLAILDKQTYDDDNYSWIVKEALKLTNVKRSGTSSTSALQQLKESNSVLYNELNQEKSTSIKPVTDPKEAFEFIKNAPECKLHFSLKLDGVNTKTYFDNGKLEIALSRGRAADSLDYTETILNNIEYRHIDCTNIKGRVTGESFVTLSDLNLISSRHLEKDPYKTPKSLAMAMLRSPGQFSKVDLDCLHFYAFSYNDELPDYTFDTLEKAGFEVPPYLIFSKKDIPLDTLENFNNWMDSNVLEILDKKGEELDIASDGVVVYILSNIENSRADKYSDQNIAIKYGQWLAREYESTVTRIITEQKRVEASLVLEIEPVIMRDHNTATRVGIGSPDILIKEGICVGSRIKFERKSDAYCVFVTKID